MLRHFLRSALGEMVARSIAGPSRAHYALLHRYQWCSWCANYTVSRFWGGHCVQRGEYDIYLDLLVEIPVQTCVISSVAQHTGASGCFIQLHNKTTFAIWTFDHDPDWRHSIFFKQTQLFVLNCSLSIFSRSMVSLLKIETKPIHCQCDRIKSSLWRFDLYVHRNAQWNTWCTTPRASWISILWSEMHRHQSCLYREGHWPEWLIEFANTGQVLLK